MKSNIVLLQALLIQPSYYRKKQTSRSMWPTQLTPAAELCSTYRYRWIPWFPWFPHIKTQPYQNCFECHPIIHTPLDPVLPLQSTISVMPKSKRAKVVHLTKTQKKGKELTLRLYANIRECIPQYPYIYVFSVENMRNNYLKSVRSELASDSRYVVILVA